MCKLRGQWTTCFSADDGASEMRAQYEGIQPSSPGSVRVDTESLGAPQDVGPHDAASSSPDDVETPGHHHDAVRFTFQENWLAEVCGVSRRRLTVKNVEESKNQSRDGTKLDNGNEIDEAPTLEEARKWSESFDVLMQGKCGRKVFREFLRSEYSEENMLFFMACEELKKEDSAELVEEKARLIYEDYISILSPKEVSLDSRVREVINRNMVEPTPRTFDEAQLQIYTLMHRDSYPRFLNSQIYKRLLQS